MHQKSLNITRPIADFFSRTKVKAYLSTFFLFTNFSYPIKLQYGEI